MDQDKKNGIERAIKLLKKEYVVVGKTRVRSWHAWLAIGLAAGILAGVLFVANRSGEFETGEAAGFQAIISPNGGEIVQIGSTLQIKWRMSGFLGGVPLNIDLVSMPNIPTQPILKHRIATVRTGAWSYSWVVPNTISPGAYKISICFTTCASVLDQSDAPFSIYSEFYIRDLSFPKGIVGASYVYPPPSTSIMGDTRWSVAKGSLPPGLSISTGIGMISGVPTTAGSFTFTLKVDLGAQSAYKEFTIVINSSPKSSPQPSITVLSPNGGEVWTLGQGASLTWTTTGVPSTNMITAGVRNIVTGQDRTLGLLSNDGNEIAAVPLTFPVGSYLGFLKTSINGQIISDFTDGPIKIVTPSTQPSITVISPNGKEIWQIGSQQTITWSAPSTIPKIVISIVGQVYPFYNYTLTNNEPNDGSFTWTVARDIFGNSILPGNYIMRVSNPYTSPTKWDDGNAPFSITPKPPR